MFIGVEYFGVQLCCSKCESFGHDCSLPPPRVANKRNWRVKQSIVVARSKVIELGSDDVGTGLEKEVSEQVAGSKVKEVVVDIAPPVTPSSLPSQVEFNKVINGAGSKSIVNSFFLVLHCNAFEALCSSQDIKLQASVPKKMGKEDLRSKGAVTKVTTLRNDHHSMEHKGFQ
ncbi:unnamed protein product [Linum trigynum]|uniref:Uncharacterized protein n=1 Tax=Linum trigynum TaxID=586398 RepID=A0AAV2FSF0_9ROSI